MTETTCTKCHGTGRTYGAFYKSSPACDRCEQGAFEALPESDRSALIALAAFQRVEAQRAARQARRAARVAS